VSLAEGQRNHIDETIKQCIKSKLEKYKPETKHMPFHDRLLGRDRMAVFSFIHSLNTSFGMSIFEPIAEALALLNFPVARKQFEVGNSISTEAQAEIQDIINRLSAGDDPDKTGEIERIRKVCQRGHMTRLKPVKADLYLKDQGGAMYLFDLKTAKPNKGNFKEFKRTMLEWAAIVLARNPRAEVNTIIAIPYNPYEPKPYERWTAKGMLDLHHELKVANEFWDFLYGSQVYEDLLACFERAGIELKAEIDEYFGRFSNRTEENRVTVNAK